MANDRYESNELHKKNNVFICVFDGYRAYICIFLSHFKCNVSPSETRYFVLTGI